MNQPQKKDVIDSTREKVGLVFIIFIFVKSEKNMIEFVFYKIDQTGIIHGKADVRMIFLVCEKLDEILLCGIFFIADFRVLKEVTGYRCYPGFQDIFFCVEVAIEGHSGYPGFLTENCDRDVVVWLFFHHQKKRLGYIFGYGSFTGNFHVTDLPPLSHLAVSVLK